MGCEVSVVPAMLEMNSLTCAHMQKSRKNLERWILQNEKETEGSARVGYRMRCREGQWYVASIV
jgi:hypothetical protein